MVSYYRNSTGLGQTLFLEGTNKILHTPRPRGKEKKEPEKIFEEITVKNFPKMEKEILDQVQEVQGVPGRMNPRKNTPSHTAIKLTKTKDKMKY